MPEEVLLVVKIRVPRADAYVLKEEFEEHLEDFFLAENEDVKLETIDIEDVK